MNAQDAATVAAWRIAVAYYGADADLDELERALPRVKILAAMRFYAGKLQRLLKRRAALGLPLDPDSDVELARCLAAAEQEELADLVPAGGGRIHEMHRALPPSALFTYEEDQAWRRRERHETVMDLLAERLAESEAEGERARRAALHRRLGTLERLRDLALSEESADRKARMADIVRRAVNT